MILVLSIKMDDILAYFCIAESAIIFAYYDKDLGETLKKMFISKRDKKKIV